MLMEIETDMVEDARIKWIDRPIHGLPTWESTDAALVISSSDKNTPHLIVQNNLETFAHAVAKTVLLVTSSN